MSSLKADFNELMERIKQGREFGHASFEPIFYLVFPPNQILNVKRETPAWMHRLRNEGWEDAQPIVIGNNVWIGAQSIVLGGVTIGDNCVIAAGSVVTKNIPANTLAMGSPCRAVREIGADFRERYLERIRSAGA